MIRRIVGTVFAVLVYGWAMMAYTPQSTLVTGQVAGRQFQNSDAGYLTAVYTFNLFTAFGTIMTLVLLIVLIAIWFKPVRDAVKSVASTILVVFAVGTALLLGATDSKAFFEKADRTEAYTILPNESAFWIPDVGANKDTQAKLDSEAYLNENKIAAKRFVIPHQKLTGSAGSSVFSGWDYYVPTGRLIIVDRTPFSREWVNAEDRGTSTKKEGFPCQAKGGENITPGISIGTSVHEKDAAKFMYRFGVNPPVGPDGKVLRIKGDAASIVEDGKIIFTSVYYGRSLKEVMDDVGRKKVQTLVCDQIGIRDFDTANAEMIKMMKDIEKDARAYFESVGVTLDFIGWADSFEFDKPVQEAINRLYVAKQEEKIGKMLQPYTEILKVLADAQAIRKFGDATDGKLPTTFVGPAPAVASPLLTLPNVPRTAPAPTPAPAR